jgi:ribonuclease P protein component
MTGSDESYPKISRLVKTAEFRKIYKSGSSYSSGPFIMKVLPNTIKINRIGFSISSRSIKKASKRNRIRRLFREAFRKNKAKLKQGFDAVLIVRKEAGDRFSYNEAESIFLNLAKKAKALL